jgi:hypothetical protein
MVEGKTLFEYGKPTVTWQQIRDIWRQIINSPPMNTLGIVDLKSIIQ